MKQHTFPSRHGFKVTVFLHFRRGRYKFFDEEIEIGFVDIGIEIKFARGVIPEEQSLGLEVCGRDMNEMRCRRDKQ